MQMNETYEKLAQNLANAWVSGGTISLPVAADAPVSRVDAYTVQDRMAELIGSQVSGWKVGAAVKAVQFFEGHDGPLPGRVFAERTFQTDGVVLAKDINGAKAECEFAFVLNDALPEGMGLLTADDIIDKITFHPAIELAATRFAPGTGGRATTTFDGVADKGTGSAAVLGEAVLGWRNMSLETMPIDACIGGSPAIQAYSGIYRQNPVELMAETLTDLRARGINFEPGMFLLTGSSTLPTPIRQGQTLSVQFGDLPPLSLRLQ